MDDLVTIVREEVAKYAGNGRAFKVRLFPMLDDERLTYGVNAVGMAGDKRVSLIVVLARIVDGQVIIEEDNTDKPLYEALQQRGLSRDVMILAYDGAPVPDA